MENCIFCKIVKKEIPSNIVYEDKRFLAFLDIRPESPGHTLLIPKDHHRWVWDVPNIGEYFEAATTIVKAQRKAFGVEQVIAKVMGEEVPHAHLWLIPDPTIKGDKKDFEGNKNKIVSAMKNI